MNKKSTFASTVVGAQRQVAFIDTGLPDFQTLLNGLSEGVEVVLVSPDQDGIQVMAEWAETHSDYDAIHILGHGSVGVQHLGSAVLSNDSLATYRDQLSQIGSALTDKGDILLYGCNIAAEPGAEEFIERLSQITEADIAASDDATGDSQRGGDWELELRSGVIESSIAVTAETQESYGGLLVAPSSQTFDSETGSLAVGYNYTTLASGNGSGTTISWSDSKGWTYTINNSTPDAQSWNYILNAGNGYSPEAALGNNYLGVEADLYYEQTFDYFTFASTDGSEFKLNSFYLMADETTGTDEAGSTPFTAVITGYMNGAAVSGATKSLAVADVDSYALTLVDVSSDTDFGNVDQIRIAISGGGITQLWLDSIDIAAAVAANSAPTLSDPTAIDSGTITEDTSSSTATTVSSILTSANYADTDGTTNKGIAVYGSAGVTTGTWQYSTDSGSNWYSFGTVSTSAALLLDATAQVRYVPDGTNSETGNFLFVGWDKTSGTQSSGASQNHGDITIRGGTTAFSTKDGAFNVTVTAVNDAPTIGNGATATLTAIDEGTTSSGTQLSSLFTALGYADVDTGYSSGLAITGTTGTGTWQYSTDNNTWSAMGTVSASSALLLTSSSYVRFISTAESGETATLTVKGWDQTSGSSSTSLIAQKDNATSTGGTTAYSSNSGTISLTVNSVNDAPTLTDNGNAPYPSVAEDYNSIAPTAYQLLTTVGYADADGTTDNGIAIYATVGNGAWQYSTDNGTNWYNIGTVSASSALLLDGTAKVRYSPDLQNGETATISFKAWDKTSGSASSGSSAVKVSVASAGGATAFSSSNATATLTVDSINDAPTITNGSNANLTAINEGATGSGTQLSSLLSSLSYADVDTGYSSGLAITGKTGTGTWQYSTDNSTWNDVGTVSESAALLLTSSTYVRFISTGNNGETATLTAKGWDQTAGSASTNSTRNTADATSGFSGGVAAYSVNSATISQVVNSVNDAPTMSAGAIGGSTNEDTTSSGYAVSSLLTDFGAADVDTGASSGIAIYSASGNGTWQYTTDNTNWYAFGTVSVSSSLLLASSAQLRYVPDSANSETASISFRAWDQSSGTATSDNTKGTANTGTTGGSSAFSSNIGSYVMNVFARNDAPTVGSGLTASLTAIDEGATGSGTQLSSLLTSLGYFDLDTGAISGLAITAKTGTGTWQYSTDNSTWAEMGSVSAASALLLTASSYVRFISSGETGETATLSVKGWDTTTGSASTNSTANHGDTTSSGGTTAFSSNTANITQAITEVNDVPVIANLDQDSLAYLEGAGAKTLDQGTAASITDVDSTDFNSGSLTVAIASGSTDEDLTIDTSGLVSLSAGMTAGSVVSVSSIAIGTITSNGQDGSNLVIVFNSADAIPAAISTLASAIQYTHNSIEPSGSRDVTFTLTDGDGGTSAISTVTVNLTGVNGAPTLTANGQDPVFIEDGAMADLFANIVVDAVESTDNIRALTLSVSNLTDGVDEKLSVDGQTLSLSNGSAGTTAANGFGYSIAVSGSTATVTLTKIDSTANWQTLVDGLGYLNTSNNPSTVNRTVTLTSITDTGGTGNGGSDTTNLSLASSVTVAASNDAPTSVDTIEFVPYNGRYTFTVDDFGFSDVDNGDALVRLTIKTLPAAGHLTLDDVVITETNTQVSLAQLTEGLLVFVPATNGTGEGYASFTFTVNDGISNSAVPNTVTLNVDAPPPAPEPEPETPPVPESEEDLVTSPTGVSGDGNDDGIPDRDQDEVASVPFLNTPTPSTEPEADPIYVSLTGGTADGKSSDSGTGVTLRNVQQLDLPEGGIPEEMDMPLGLIAFEADIQTVGSTETFSLYVDDTLSINGYWKQDASGEWVNLASSDYSGKVVLEGSKLRLDFQITDGGEFDEDGEANGTIVDPGALAFVSDSFSDEVQALYIAYYQRPADSAGLAYWVDYLNDQNGSLENVVDAFANSAESQALYGDITHTSVDAFIIDLYTTLFDRAVDNAGLTYYRNAFIAGEYEDGRPATAGTLMLDILKGAQNRDADLVDLKLAAARTFTWLLDPNQDGEVLATFDADDLTTVRDWLQGLAESDIAPGVGAVYDLIKDEVAEYGDSITLVGSGGVTELLF